MSDKWKVNDGTQVAFGDKLHQAGDTFSATEAEVAAEGLTAYVSKVRQQSAPKAENKAQSAPQPHKADPKADDKPAEKASDK